MKLFPKVLPIGGPATYLLQEGLVALYRRNLPAKLEVIDELADPPRRPILVCRIASTKTTLPIDNEVFPVYSTVANGPVAVPTGRVYVRTTPQTRIGSYLAEIERAGYRVVEEPSYAPNTAWVEPITGGVWSALAAIDQLKAIPGIEHVEPQMLRQRRKRSSRD